MGTPSTMMGMAVIKMDFVNVIAKSGLAKTESASPAAMPVEIMYFIMKLVM